MRVRPTRCLIPPLLVLLILAIFPIALAAPSGESPANGLKATVPVGLARAESSPLPGRDETPDAAKAPLPGEHHELVRVHLSEVSSVPDPEATDAAASDIKLPLVELLSWPKVSRIFTEFKPARVYDVRTGAVYYVQSFGNGNHADVEPLTREDTKILYSTYGNHWDWTPRPVWVTINGHTIAGSINGMPHASGTIADNGMDGQVCIHFKGSATHNGNLIFGAKHQRAVGEAWQAYLDATQGR